MTGIWDFWTFVSISCIQRPICTISQLDEMTDTDKIMHPQHFGTDPTDIRICFLFCVCCFCSQRVYLLKQLRDQGLPLQKLHTVFQAIVLSRLMYALPAWGPLLNVELVHKIDGFLKRSFRYGFTNKLITIQALLDSATEDLFCKMKSPNHCLHPLFPPDRTLNQVLRTRGHSFQLPTCSFNLHKKSFVVSCLYKFLT